MRIIDPIINAANAWTAKAEFTRRAETELFDATSDFSRDVPAADMVALLDKVGVERAIVGIDPEHPADFLLEYTRSYPDRFAFAAEPRFHKHGLDALWAMEDLCAAHPVVAVRAAPMFVKQPATEPVWYPLYVKCIELDIPLCLTTGIPGPPLLPADVQNPMHLDPVLLDFPALKLVMLHGADPWWGVAMRLLLRHRNLHMVTSAWAPKYLPRELIDFMNSRGGDKVMFGSDHPVLGLDRAVREAQEIGLRPEVLEKYLCGNAERVFFGERRARHITHVAAGS
jgi:predicted TIM-barrel fold metal-dependent hydrolase